MEAIASVRRVSHSPLAADGGTRRSRRVGFRGDLRLGDLGLDEHAARKMSAMYPGCCLGIVVCTMRQTGRGAIRRGGQTYRKPMIAGRDVSLK